jgi:hypothetical protein
MSQQKESALVPVSDSSQLLPNLHLKGQQTHQFTVDDATATDKWMWQLRNPSVEGKFGATSPVFLPKGP